MPENTIDKLKGCAKVVAAVLSNDSSARDNDRTLVRLVWENYGLFFTDEQAEIFFSKRVPAADTITRAARKLKEENAHLRGSARNQALRSQNEQETQQRIPSTTITPKPAKRGFLGFGKAKEQGRLL
jgi:hypothetical protein